MPSHGETKFRHPCAEWDGMVIDETDREFAACSCFDNPEAKAASERHTAEHQAEIDREYAIALARKHIRLKPQSYYAEPFQPHEWVINAIVEALNE